MHIITSKLIKSVDHFSFIHTLLLYSQKPTSSNSTRCLGSFYGFLNVPCGIFFVFSPFSYVELHSQEQEVVIALGSNVGNRLHNFSQALHLEEIWHYHCLTWLFV